MAEQKIDDAHHIMRWVPKTKLRHDPDTNEPIGPMPIAFRLRVEQGEHYLSASWIEHISVEYEQQIATTAKQLAKQVHTTPSKGGAFAIGRVSEIKTTCKIESNIEPRIVSTPSGKSPAYAQVWGIPHDDLTLQTALAFGSWANIVRASNVLD